MIIERGVARLDHELEVLCGLGHELEHHHSLRPARRESSSKEVVLALLVHSEYSTHEKRKGVCKRLLHPARHRRMRRSLSIRGGAMGRCLSASTQLPIGAMEEVSRKVHKASTHHGGLIRVDGAAGKRHCASRDGNTATLPADAK